MDRREVWGGVTNLAEIKAKVLSMLCLPYFYAMVKHDADDTNAANVVQWGKFRKYRLK